MDGLRGVLKGKGWIRAFVVMAVEGKVIHGNVHTLRISYQGDKNVQRAFQSKAACSPESRGTGRHFRPPSVFPPNAGLRIVSPSASP